MIGKLLKEYLNDKGIKQTFLAQKTGMTDATISDICNRERKVDCVEYYKICKALDLPLGYFLDQIDTEQ